MARRTWPRTVAAALAVGLALTACASGGDDVDTETSDTLEPEGPAVAPLTGLPADDQDLATRPALVVKIDNQPRAIGVQAGINVADVVYNERVEGGATRLAAVFHSTGADEVGPVRSARTTDIGIVASLDRPLLAYSGANAGVLRMVAEADVVDVGYDEVPRAYRERGTGVLRFFIDTSDFFPLAPESAGPPPALFPYREEGDPPQRGERVGGITVDYGGAVGTQVRYEPVGEGWARTQDGEPHVDADGVRVAPENVVIAFTAYRDSGFADSTGAASPEAVLVGEGDAWILTGGRLIEGRWRRPNEEATPTYSDATGAPITLTPGRTWVELAPPGSGERIEAAPAG